MATIHSFGLGQPALRRRPRAHGLRQALEEVDFGVKHHRVGGFAKSSLKIHPAINYCSTQTILTAGYSGGGRRLDQVARVVRAQLVDALDGALEQVHQATVVVLFAEQEVDLHDLVFGDHVRQV